MSRPGSALLLSVLLAPACAGGEQWRVTDSTTTLGGEDEDSEEESGPVISASASASASGPTSSESTTEATMATTDPVDASTSSEGSTTSESLTDGSSGSSGSSSGESSTTGDPTMIDFSGWSIVQTESDRTFVIPDGTLVPIGGALIVARDSDEAAFEAYWGVPFGSDVVFLSGGNDFPTINGDETYALRDASDGLVDGPSPPVLLGESLDRIDPEDDGATGWVSGTADVGTPSPGTSTDPPDGFGDAFLSEVSDANGNGNFVYEFVEVRAF